MPLPVRPPWVARLLNPSRNTFRGGGNGILGFFLLHPGLCPETGRTKLKWGLEESLSSADPERGGLGRPQEREVCKLRLPSCWSHRTLEVTQDSGLWWPAGAQDMCAQCGSEKGGLAAQACTGICAGLWIPGPLPWGDPCPAQG